MKEKTKKFFRRLLYKYRFTVLNEDRLEEKASVRFSGLNVLIILSIHFIILFFISFTILEYTSFREYFFGQSMASLNKKIYDSSMRIDSMGHIISNNKKYMNELRKTLLGDTYIQNMNERREGFKKPQDLKVVEKVKEDRILRDEIELEDRYNVDEDIVKSYILFSPVKGFLTSSFNLQEKHFGVDIATPKNTAVRAIGNGTVIFSEWTAETGHVIIINHENSNLISVYKHNEYVTKEQGDFVNAGESIAFVGNTGKYSTGYHLHFELWIKNIPIDPKGFIVFD